MNIKRIVNRTFEELRATYMISKVISIREAITTFIAKVDIQVLSRNGYKENDSQKKRLLKKHDVMMKYFNITFKDFLDKYDGPKNSEEDVDMSDTIWVCWWQGYDNAPEIVKKCIDSMKMNCGSKKVVIIDESNYKITYRDAQGKAISSAPKKIGKYYAVITVKGNNVKTTDNKTEIAKSFTIK